MQVKTSDGYDNLYPQTSIDNVQGIQDQYFTKEESLQKNVAQLYGLNGIDAIPNKAFEYLGKFNLYWWKRRSITENKSEETTVFFATGTSTSANTNAYYSDTITVKNGVVALNNPTTFNLSYNATTAKNTLRGKYFSYREETTVYYIPSDATIVSYNRGSSYAWPYGLNIDCSVVTVTMGEWEYVQSSDEEAYPSGGLSGGYEYQSVGIPFHNAVEGIRLATGSYVGTGTYGANNPNTLTFDFSPYLILIYGILQSASNGVDSGYTLINKVTGTFNSLSVDANEIHFTYGNAIFNGGMVSWYGTSSMSTGAAQANNSNGIYYYIAIGTGGGGGQLKHLRN